MSAQHELDDIADEIKRLYADRQTFERDSIEHHREALKEFDLKIKNAHHRKAEIMTRFRTEARDTSAVKKTAKPVEVLEVPKVKKK